jgi:hypothetical protein
MYQYLRSQIAPAMGFVFALHASIANAISHASWHG